LTPDVREESEVPKLVRSSPALARRACEEKALLGLSRKVRLGRDSGEVVPHSLLLSLVGSSRINVEAAQGSRPLPSFLTLSASANPLMKRQQGA
jgi:hypothetical protein